MPASISSLLATIFMTPTSSSLSGAASGTAISNAYVPALSSKWTSLEMTRLVVIESGKVALAAIVDAKATPPIPPGHRRPAAARREAFTLDAFDRLRVLTTELKRLTAAGARVALRLGAGPALDDTYGISVLATADRAVAEAFRAGDPVVKEGLMRGELHPWRASIGSLVA